MQTTTTTMPPEGFYFGALGESCSSRCAQLELTASDGAEAVDSAMAFATVSRVLGFNVNELCKGGFTSSVFPGAPAGECLSGG